MLTANSAAAVVHGLPQPSRRLSPGTARRAQCNARASRSHGSRAVCSSTISGLAGVKPQRTPPSAALSEAQQDAALSSELTEVQELQKENERLREAAAAKLAELSPEAKQRILDAFAALQQDAQAAGIIIPSLGPSPETNGHEETAAADNAAEAFDLPADTSAPEAPFVSSEASAEAPLAVHATTPEISDVKAQTASVAAECLPGEEQEAVQQLEDSAAESEAAGGPTVIDGVTISRDADDTVTFSFGSMFSFLKRKKNEDGDDAPPGISNRSKSTALQPHTADTSTGASIKLDEAKAVEEPTPSGHQAKPAQAALMSHRPDEAPPSNGTASLPQAPHQASTSQTSEPPSSSKLAALREAARQEVEGHDPAAVCAGRAEWLYFTLPQQPVAGEDVVVFLNKNASEPLRHRPRLNAHIKYNEWQLEGSHEAWVDLAWSGAPTDDGSDWWSVRVRVPDNAYELNYVFSDCEGTVDNNTGLNFKTDVLGDTTREDWLAAAPERAEAEEKARAAAEAAAAAEAEQQRQAALAQQDWERARGRVEALRGLWGWAREGALHRLQHGDAGSQAPVAWMTSPEVVRPGGRARLLYNNRAGPLAFLSPFPEGQSPTLRYGFNAWATTQDVQMRPAAQSSSGGAEGDWWEADVEVPGDAVVANFVIQYWEHFDNNYGMDHKLLIDPPGEVEDWFTQLEKQFHKEEHSARKRAEAEAAEKERRKAEARAATRAKANAVTRRQMRHVLFCEPAELQAGQQVTLYYNPIDTPLSGRQRIWLRGGFNRWRHPKSFGPLEMAPPADGDHFRVTLDVPRDAYKLDFVFSDVESGEGTYDNRGGFDYHLPVSSSVVSEPPLHVVHVAVEMAPICKVGGLGDVVTALGRAVKEEGNLVEVILPRYDFFLASPLLGATQYEFEFEWGGTYIYVSSCIVEGLRCFFIEPQNGFFAVDAVYGRKDDEVRFDFFCKAALEFLLLSGRQPDILHCHDWSTAGLARIYWQDYHQNGLWKPKIVFTIHNMEFGIAKIGEAAFYCQRFTTVSPTYAFEVGGSPAIAAHTGKFMGIRNGIDIDIWDPENDQYLPLPFSADTLVEGKAAAREALRYCLGLTGWGDKPVVGVVSRLTAQKGIHLIKHAAWRTLERGGQFVLLGSAPDPKVQAEFNGLAGQLTGENAAFCFSYDEPLSHLIYAACDIVLVPSMFEPCGLTQLIAMRYGSVPVVRHTGGLRDTVFDVDYDRPRAAWDIEGSSDCARDGIDATNGFAFEGTDGGAVDFALNRALDAYYNDRAWFHSLQQRVARQDWSWNRPAIDYIELYYAAMKS